MFEEEDFRAAAERDLGRRLTPSKKSRHWFRRAWAHILSRPGFALQVMARADMIRARDGRRSLAAGATVAVTLSPSAITSARVHQDRPQQFVNLGAIYDDRRDLASAERMLADGLRSFPRSAMAQCAMGRLRIAQGRSGEAIDLLTRCIHTVPMHPRAWLSLGQAYQGIGDLAVLQLPFPLTRGNWMAISAPALLGCFRSAARVLALGRAWGSCS